MPNAIAFMTGHLVVHQFSALPALPVLAFTGFAALGALGLAWRQSGARLTRNACGLAAWLLLGITLAGWRGQAALENRLAPALEDREFMIDGVVVGLAQASERGWRFRLRPHSAWLVPLGQGRGAGRKVNLADRPDLTPLALPEEVMLSWNRGFERGEAAQVQFEVSGNTETQGAAPRQAPAAGEFWRVQARLRRPHALANPGLFDAELRALEEGVGASGSVRGGQILRPLRWWELPWRAWVDAQRDGLRTAMRQAMIETSAPAATSGLPATHTVASHSANPATAKTGAEFTLEPLASPPDSARDAAPDSARDSASDSTPDSTPDSAPWSQRAPDSPPSSQRASDPAADSGPPSHRAARRAGTAKSAFAMPQTPAAERAAAVLIALAVGDQNAIGAADWTLFQRTGVSHLMSISGMHVTMLAALGGVLMHRLLHWSWLCGWLLPWVSRRTAVRVAAVFTAFAYAQLAGWGLPAQRTFWMLAAAALAGVVGRSRSTTDVLAVAAAMVVLLDPWAVMSIGFWLSFCAVAIIVWAGQGLPLDDQQPAQSTSRFDRIRTALHAGAVSQAAATIALAPLSAWFFASVSLIGPLANLFAIPIVTFVVTPAALLGAALAALCPPIAHWLLWPAARITQGLFWALEPLADLPAATWGVAEPSLPLLLLAALGGIWLFAPRAVPARWLGLVLLLPSMLVPRERPAPGTLWLTAFDVGQGSALLLETASQTLLYDTGPRMGPQVDAGNRVLLPALRARGIQSLDRLVISHADEDHSGGAQSLLRELPVRDAIASLPNLHPLRRHSRNCLRGETWQADGIHFEVLHPGETVETAVRSPTNAVSCVLAVTAPGGRVLLTGDLESAQERLLIERLRPTHDGASGLRSEVLIVPHHGSQTSSSPEFLAAVAPKLAVFQVGWHNRYQHPHPKVLARYQEAGIGILRTDRDGAIRLVLQAEQPPRVERFRIDDARYWRVSEAWR
jgi:competence protein ComEC